MTFWNSDPLERKYSVAIIYIGKWVSVDRWQFSEPEVGQLCEMAILKKNASVISSGKNWFPVFGLEHCS